MNLDECLVTLCNIFKLIFGFELDMRIGKLLFAWKAGEFGSVPTDPDANAATTPLTLLKQVLPVLR